MPTPSTSAELSDAPAAPAPPSPRRRGRGCLVAAAVGGAVVVAGAVSLYLAWQDMTGGPVRSVYEYEERKRVTMEAGVRVIGQLRPEPRLAGALPGATPEDTAETDTSPSCADDFGVDDSDVTREQLIFSWDLTFDSPGDYRAAVRRLREEWVSEGLSVRAVPAPGKGERGHGLPGIATTDDGVDLVFAPDSYSGEPVVRVDGGCVRHRS
ncbi:hypothetical protein RB200_05790 [Streptomyces sp. PmtG]